MSGRHAASPSTDATTAFKRQFETDTTSKRPQRRRADDNGPRVNRRGRTPRHGSPAPGLPACRIHVRRRDQEDHRGDGAHRRLAHRQGAAEVDCSAPVRRTSSARRVRPRRATRVDDHHPLPTGPTPRAAAVLRSRATGPGRRLLSNAIKAAEPLGRLLARGQRGHHVHRRPQGRRATTASAAARSRHRGPASPRTRLYADARAIADAADRGVPHAARGGRRRRNPRRLHRFLSMVTQEAAACAAAALEASRRPRTRRAPRASPPLLRLRAVRRGVSTRCCRGTSRAASTTRCSGRRFRARRHPARDEAATDNAEELIKPSRGCQRGPVRPKSPRKSARSSAAPRRPGRRDRGE